MYGTLRIYIPNEQGVLVRHGLGFERNDPRDRLWQVWKTMDHGMLCIEDSDEPLDVDSPLDPLDDVALVLRDWKPEYEHVRAALAARQFPVA